MGKWTLSEPPWWGPTPEGRGSGAGVPCPVLTWRWMQEEADRKSSDRELPGRRGWWTRDRTERWVGAPGRSQSERRAQESPGHAVSDVLPALPSSAAWPTWPPDKASRATSSSTPPTCCSSISECPSPPSTWPCGLSTLPGAPPSLRGPPSALPAALQFSGQNLTSLPLRLLLLSLLPAEVRGEDNAFYLGGRMPIPTPPRTIHSELSLWVTRRQGPCVHP